ncbi:hypothetical protein AHMF7605_20950 [Adhaeribacter arboris]|uniref:Uncharacterized protein n=1 Tax=Adhaeribacter arboris TaxID=2072846 RepID=A0A2T2YJW0_9BACT|nr:hypothetical protein [Adhaeribacter arboris]PSR55790.1 hypothetical protein AHMF7605_20950 [Adhaeribacter arboris]
MESPDEIENAFPPEYSHVGERVREAQERIQQIEEQIKNVPSDRGTAPQYNPPVFLRPRQPGDHNQTVKSLEKQISQIKDDVMRSVDKEIVDADPQTARTVRDKTRESLYPNPYKKMDATKMEAAKSQSRDLDASQDYKDAQLNREPAPDLPEREQDAPDQANPQPTQQEKKPLSMSARFSQSLSSTKVIEKDDKAPDKTPNPEKGKEEKDKD